MGQLGQWYVLENISLPPTLYYSTGAAEIGFARVRQHEYHGGYLLSSRHKSVRKAGRFKYFKGTPSRFNLRIKIPTDKVDDFLGWVEANITDDWYMSLEIGPSFMNFSYCLEILFPEDNLVLAKLAWSEYLYRSIND